MMDIFSSLDGFAATLREAPGPDVEAATRATQRDAILTKPPGALGRLEELAIWYCTWRAQDRPMISAPQVIVFAGNHGVTAQGVSAFPSEVTQQMVLNFQQGGAAINQLTASVGARLDVIPLDLDHPTADFTQGPAMSESEVVAALLTGWRSVDSQVDVLVVGEMGIGNTTSAAALAHLLCGGEAADWAGRGTGVDDAGLALKTRVIAKAVDLHRDTCSNGLEALCCLGGRELAAMAGAISHARHLRIPVILDGFICTAAAACLEYTQPGALDHTVAGHASAEAAHQSLLEKLGKAPLLSLGMRLGEGSGGALAISVLKGAVACHSGMASFAEAGVSDS